jgi:ABC-2 type transport system ATP-binding protein
MLHMIQVDNVTKYFGPVMAVERVSFQVSKGEIVGFLGLNGAGKTTTMRILTTYLPATSGIARVAGFDVMNQSMDVRRNIGYLPESVPLYQEMRVDEYLDYRAKLKGVDRKQRQQRVEYCLDRCRVREVRRRLIGTLSKGYRQRVGLADSMVHNPPILIMDEPTVGLDPLQIEQTLNLIKELGQEHTIMFSTHILSEVSAICERVIIIQRGRITVDKKLADVAADKSIIMIEIRGPVEQVTNVLRATDGVAEVTLEAAGDDLNGFEIRTHENKDLREAIFERVVKNGWTIRRLDIRRPSLKDLFVNTVMRTQDTFADGDGKRASEAIQPKPAETAVTEAQ